MLANLAFWRLVTPAILGEPFIVGTHNPWLCTLAVVIAMCAAGVLLPVTQRYWRSGAGHRTLWLAGGSLAMGTGIWAMNFTAMLAYRLPLAVSYDPLITLVSILPAVAASAYCIVHLRPSRGTRSRLHRVAITLALGVATMHYLGMEAIVVAADMYYSPLLFGISVIAAYPLALVGLYIYAQTARSMRGTSLIGISLSSAVLGLAVSAMHFIAMRATYFVPTGAISTDHLTMNAWGIATAIAVIALFLIALLVAGTLVDRRLSQMSSSLRDSELRFSQLAQNTRMAIFTFDRNGVTYANPALSEITGYSNQQIKSMSLSQLFGESFSLLAEDILTPPLLLERTVHEEFRITTRAGEPRWMYFSISLAPFHDHSEGLASGVDLTHQKAAEKSLRQLAYHDQLTGLANRAKFIDRLDHHLALLARTSGNAHSCVMLMDLDGFKGVNDNLGHQTGDELLRGVAKRLCRASRDSDTVARLGGDEFVLLFENLERKMDCTGIADKLVSLFAEPFDIDGRPVEVGTSVGVLPLGTAYTSADEVLRDADIALYRAKNQGQKSSWVLFDDTLDATSKRYRALREELAETIADSGLTLFYQPVIDVSRQRTCEFEAIIQWQRDNGEWVAREDFLLLAERLGLVDDIGLWALNAVARQITAWRRQSPDEKIPAVTLNLAVTSFNDERLLKNLKQRLREQPDFADYLRLGVAEEKLVTNAEALLGELDYLDDLGIGLVLDEFGNGLSSLRVLNRLNLRAVRLDRRLVAQLEDSEQVRAAVESALYLARQLDIASVCDGVTNATQAELLEAMGCMLMQGDYWGKPIAGDKVRNYSGKLDWPTTG